MRRLVRADLARIGIRARPTTRDWNAYRAAPCGGAPTMMLYGWTRDNGDPDDVMNVLLGCRAAAAGGADPLPRCRSLGAARPPHHPHGSPTRGTRLPDGPARAHPARGGDVGGVVFCSAISLALRDIIYYPPVSSHGCHARATGCTAACQSPDVRLPRRLRVLWPARCSGRFSLGSPGERMVSWGRGPAGAIRPVFGLRRASERTMR